MRPLGTVITTVVAAMAMALFSSCSSDEPSFNKSNPLLPDSDYNSRSFADMVVTTSDIVFTLTNIESYQKDDQTGDNWKKFDYTEYIGGSVPGPEVIVVNDGKMYTEMNRWSSVYGPTHFSTALGLLIHTGVVNRGCEILISRDYNLDENSITVAGTKLNIKNIKNDKMWLTTISKFYGGPTGNGGQDLYIMTYNIGGSYEGESLRFDSIEEAYAWIIEAFRDKFGEEVNLNNYTGGTAVLDEPMFNVGMIEEELQKYREGTLEIRL